MYWILEILLFSTLCVSPVLADTCSSWFEKAKVKKDKSCLTKCISLEVDMSTFDCHDRCSEFCEEDRATSMIFSLSGLYGLTSAERALAGQEPTKTLRAYKDSWKAEALCLKIYKQADTNDESDACRHFAWAWILTKDLGADFANQVLNAHENNDKEPQNERAMDLANNRQGQIAAQSAKNSAADDDILENFKENIRKKNLIIIKQKPENRKW